ncbi:MAG: hypothetical protein WKF70_04760 [Chitinophagaceae bacterium]
MKYGLTIGFIVLLALSRQVACNKTPMQAGCYKARLEIKGICMNYTIKVLQGDIDTSLVEKHWRDENTGRKYEQVFRLETVCDFPADLAEGSEFYFTINSAFKPGGCNVCMAYYPTPSKSLAISVLRTPCP